MNLSFGQIRTSQNPRGNTDSVFRASYGNLQVFAYSKRMIKCKVATARLGW